MTQTGRHTDVSVGGVRAKAFVPAPLPPSPALVLGAELQALLASSSHMLGQLDLTAVQLPEPGILLYAYVRREAVLSSQIEGTESSLADLLLFELDEAPGVPIDDAREVSRHVAALEHGFELLRGGLPVSARLLREMHRVLFADSRGSAASPGEFRRVQNWIGGRTPDAATFVPPPHTEIERCLADLERFIHEDTSTPPLVRAALAHVQFETIHPFLDGNGRIGRLLISLMLAESNLLRSPLLYLSLFFRQQRVEYYARLNAVRVDGDWEGWLRFFLRGVEFAAGDALRLAAQLREIDSADRLKVATLGRRSRAALRVLETLRTRPMLNISSAADRSELSYPGARDALAALAELGIVQEISGKRRGKIFAYGAFLRELTAGT